MARKLMKGNYAAVYGAVMAGCHAYYGYPITPASEIAEAASTLFPLIGRTFLQAESEVAAIQMVYGAAGCGLRVMTASSCRFRTSMRNRRYHERRSGSGQHRPGAG